MKHLHILCLQFNSHLARDIGAQPDLQDLDTAPSAAFAYMLNIIPFVGCLMASTCAANLLRDPTIGLLIATVT